MKASHRHCPVCAGAEVEVLHHQRFELPAGHPLPASYDVVCCGGCGYVFADTAGNAADYDRYYADYSKYADQATSTGGGGNPRDQARLEATARAISRHVADRASCVVDIGCANGGLLGAMKAVGYTRLFGIDPAPACVENTRALFGIEAQQGWLMDLPAATPRADVIIISHVLEHVLDIRGALAHASRVLAPGGLVYVEVPDAQRYVDFLAAPFQDFNTEHINHFGAAGLENLFAAAGFVPVEIGAKTIEAAPGIGYPALFGFFRRSGAALPPAWRRDAEFRRSMDRYIAASRAGLDAIRARLQPVLHQPLIVWGTGQLTLKLLAETELGSSTIAAFVDGNPVHHGKKLRGVTILSPEDVGKLPAHPIVIGTTLHHRAIRERIRGPLALNNEIVTLAA